MFKEKLKSLKLLAENNENTNNKKKIENLVVFVIILIITVLSINMIWGKDEPKDVKTNKYTKLATNENMETESNIKISSEYNLEKDLEDILSKIDGAGKVKVLITYSESSQIVPMSNEKYKETQTDENDKTGGTRNISEKDKSSEIIYKESNGEKSIITQKVIMPKIEGALILSRRSK